MFHVKRFCEAARSYAPLKRDPQSQSADPGLPTTSRIVPTERVTRIEVPRPIADVSRETYCCERRIAAPENLTQSVADHTCTGPAAGRASIRC
jgi:hypothetical protein